MLVATAIGIEVWKFNPHHDPGSGQFATGPGGGIKVPKSAKDFGPELLTGNRRMYVLPGRKTVVNRPNEEHRHMTQRVFKKTEREMMEAGALRVGAYSGARGGPSVTYAEVRSKFVDSHSETLKMMGDWSSPGKPFSFEVVVPRRGGFTGKKTLFHKTITRPGEIDRILQQKPWVKR